MIKNKQVASIISFILLTGACIVFAVLCLHNTAYLFVSKNKVIFSILTSVLLTGLCALAIWFVLLRKETLVKTLISLYVFLLFCFILIFILQRTGFFALVKDEDAFRQYLETKGKFMPLLYVILQYLQVVILPIPSVVSTVAGVAIFGPLKTIVYSLIGIVLGSITAFFIGRKLGHKAVAWMVGHEELKKWQKKLKGKDNFILTVMFLLPMFPDDVLCFIAGLSSMSNRYFLIMIIVSRVISISTTCYSIDLIPFTTWWGLLIWAIIIIAIVATFIFIYKNMDKIQEKIKNKFGKNKK